MAGYNRRTEAQKAWPPHHLPVAQYFEPFDLASGLKVFKLLS
jgi:hypothetical protein